MSYIVRVTNRSASTEYTVPAGESRIVSENVIEKIDLDSDDKIKTIEFLNEGDNSLAASGTTVTVAAHTPAVPPVRTPGFHQAYNQDGGEDITVQVERFRNQADGSDNAWGFIFNASSNTPPLSSDDRLTAAELGGLTQSDGSTALANLSAAGTIFRIVDQDGKPILPYPITVEASFAGGATFHWVHPVETIVENDFFNRATGENDAVANAGVNWFVEVVLPDTAGTAPNALVEVFDNVADMKNGYARMSN